MKKLLAIVLSLVLLLSAFPFAALAEELSLARRPEQSEGSPSDDAILSEVQAESKYPLPEDLTNTLPSIAENMAINSGTCGNNLSWSFNTTTGVLTITGTGEMDDYDFGIDGSSSTAPWVSLSNEISSVIIGDDVETIGECAFLYCENLTSVTFGNSVTSIGKYAFYQCALYEVNLSESVTLIGEYAFCNNVGDSMSVVIPGGVTLIGEDAFAYCPLNEVTICDGVSTIGRSAFAFDMDLSSIVFPGSVTEIEPAAFYYCTSLESITIPNSVTSIGDYAFTDCENLATVNYGGTQEQWDAIVIGDENEPLLNAELVLTSQDNPAESVWQYEISDGEATLTGYTGAGGAVTIPSSLGGCPVTAIGVSAFSGCSSVSAIIIPNSVTTIGKNAFEGTGITTITIPKSVSSMSGSFWDQWETKYYSALNGASALREVIFEEGLKTIPEYALYGCSQVTRVVIPDSVTSIGGRAFNNCSGLTSLVIPDSVSSIDYVRVSSYGAPRMATIIDGCTSLKSVVIGNGVKIINASAFSRLTSLESVIIGSGVVSIGPSAFYECTSLSNVVIPDSVASIGNDAFYGCTGLTSITISDSVASIGNGAFSGCTALQRISTPFWNPNFGSDLTSLSEITVTGDSAENFAFDGYGALEKITVTAWEKVPMYAFSNCASLKEVVLPASLTKIANYAFSYSEAIETVRFAGTREQWDRIEIGVKGNDPLYNAALICEGDQTGPITTVTELTILTTPAKTTYDRNEPLDLTGMELEATYSDGSRVPVTDGYLVNGFDYKPGEKTITVIYGGASTTFTVTVRDPASPELLDQPGIIVSSAQVKPGEAFTVTVSIHDNPGISVLSAKPVYNRAFTLVSAVNGTVFSELTGGNTQLIFDALDGTSSENGTLVTLTFRAPDTDYSASFDFDLIVSAINEKEQNVALPVLPGIVELVGTLWGDANGDGKVDNKDIVRLKNYVANYDDETGISTNGTTVYTLSPGADANGDGKVDNKDIVRLKNYIANYDDTTGISSNGTTTYILGPAA